ncbi:MAG: N-6 DNA methylase [Deltaproteobacteria bacterium]|nr:N-6 DNA methylase [Deltaproteobacteria bacterium]
MLDKETRQRINSARQILVGKVPDPKAQVEQITNALIYKFMDDMDRENEELSGKAQFLAGDLKEFSWGRLMSRELSGIERWDIYTRALSSFAKSKQIPELFRTIFKDAYLPYRDSETLNLFLKEINGFSYSNSENLGNAFEYLLSILGSQGDAGQFRTPRHIIDFIVEVVNPKKTDRILDPACGTAGFLISSYKHIWRKNSSNYKAKEYVPTFAETESADITIVEIQKNGKYRGDKLNPDDRKRLGHNIVGYDISPDMVRLSLVNLYLHNFSTPQIYEYDTLTYEERWGNNFDIILANPPFMTPKGGIRPHKLFQVSANRAEVLFVDYIAEHLSINGKAGIIVPEGIIFQSANAYKALRKMLMDENYLYAVVSLPAGVFRPYSGVKTSILFIDKMLAKKSDEILFVKVENDGFDLGAQRRRIDKNDLTHAFKILQNWQKGKKTESRIALWVKKEKIAENGDYNLTGDRYKEAVDYSKVKWPMVKLGEVITTVTPPIKIKKEDFFEIGSFPIIDQSQNEIAGWIDDSESLVKGEKPFVIFGDHTCAVKYVESPFAQGADGIKILKTAEKLFPKFLYFLLKTNPVKSDGYKRHFAKLKQIQIPVPPLEVQKEIVAELNSYQKVIDGARQVAENWKPRIKINPDWPMVKFEDVCTLEYGSSLPKKKRMAGRYPVMGSNGISGYHNEFLVNGPAIIVGRKGSAGEVVWADKDCFPIDTTYYVKLTNHKKTDLRYIYLVLKSLNLQNLKGGAGIPGLNRQDVYTKHKIPLPSLEVQKQIVAEIEKEQKMVAECKKLIVIHEQKIKVKIGEVWGE